MRHSIKQTFDRFTAVDGFPEKKGCIHDGLVIKENEKERTNNIKGMRRGHMVLIASANETLRKHWARTLKEKFSIREVADRAAMEKSIARQNPSFLLLDLSLPQLGGVKAIRHIQSLNPSTKIILLTSALNDEEAISALRAGVKGYCHINVNPTLLLKALEVVQKGEIWVGRKVIPCLLDELTSFTERRKKYLSPREDIPLDRLTARELQIARSVGEGLSNKDIASRLNISERTVKAHLTSIFCKLKVLDRVRLALLITNYDQADR
jgi:DNA-binding NarL/FixJ family response regulator